MERIPKQIVLLLGFALIAGAVHAGTVNPTFRGSMPSIAGMFPADTHDVGVTQIVAPAEIVDSGDTVIPSAWVKNFGMQAEGFHVMLRIDSVYTAQDSVYLSPGDSTLASFTQWPSLERGPHVAECSTMLADDENHVNDTAARIFTVSVYDVRVISVSLSDTLPDSSSQTMMATVHNFGTGPAGFVANAQILFEDTLQVYFSGGDSEYVEAGGTTYYGLAAWEPVLPGVYLVKAWILGERSDTFEKDFYVRNGGSGVQDVKNLLAPSTFILNAPAPNPCRDAVVIRYGLPAAADIRLDLCDVSGRVVAALVRGTMSAGWHLAAFRFPQSVNRVPKGVYFVRLQSPGFEKTQKVVVAVE
jgi:hypothetical protein